MIESWRPIAGFEGLYEVSSMGRVRSLPRIVQRWRYGSVRHEGRVLAQSVSAGYMFVNLSKKGKLHRRPVAALVCEAFHGPRPEAMEAAHSDGRCRNNQASNLRWATKLENAADKKVHGTDRIGEQHPGAKLKVDQVREIKSRLASGESQHSIARAIGIGRGAICDIKRRKTWAHV